MDKSVTPHRVVVLAALVALMIGALSHDAWARGSRFRDFMTNPPEVGEKAPLFPCVDENGKRIHMSDFLGDTHLVLIFGALT